MRGASNAPDAQPIGAGSLVTPTTGPEFRYDLARSDDDGQTWENLREVSRQRGVDQAISLVADPTNPNRLFMSSSIATDSHFRVGVSTDGGATWASVADNTPEDIRAIAIGIDGANLYALAGQSKGDILRLHVP
jgi:hypothetical protein